MIKQSQKQELIIRIHKQQTAGCQTKTVNTSVCGGVCVCVSARLCAYIRVCACVQYTAELCATNICY